MTLVKLSYFNEGNFSKTRLMITLSMEENQHHYSCLQSLAQGTNKVFTYRGSHYVMMRGSLPYIEVLILAFVAWASVCSLHPISCG